MAALNRSREKFAVMTSPFSRDIFTTKYPRLFSPVVIPLAIFIVFVTWYFWISLSCPVGSAVRSHLCGTSHARVETFALWEGGRVGKVDNGYESEKVNGNETGVVNDKEPDVEYHDITGPVSASQVPVIQVDSSDEALPSDEGSREQASDISVSAETKEFEDNGSNEITFIDDFQNSEDLPETSSETSASSDCDLFHGQWIYDPAGPLYTNNSCPVLSQSQNCQGNGRPDKEYENWRWKPFQCELPRFNATKFLELMSGKTVTFAGDSVARNQMESLLCLLWQVETPKNRGNRRMQRWYFRSHSVTVIRIWSSWLVHHTSEAFSYIPEGITKIHLDKPDENIMELAPKSDVIVVSNGHWFTKTSAYLFHDEIVGTQSWSPPKNQQPMNFTNMEAFGITTETTLTALGTSQNYSGLTILMSYSPDHYEHGAWNTGGSCTGKDKPLLPGQLMEPQYTKIMHEKQLSGFHQAVKKKTNKSKLKLMDITEAFGYRHDGHPGPYRSTNPNKVTKRGPNGRPPPQDCLHWCMPGPIDTWNELMLETIRREFEGVRNTKS
ncbi:protein YLS7-like [Silene latifolia]|uniref:protein YLS7-like n=1 Tax=Silene latifolia TaxID=37657 RepID=UPI003D77F10D